MRNDVSSAGRDGENRANVNDFIRVYVGLMGSGKTTLALRDVDAAERVLIYSPGTSHSGLLKYADYIYDTPEYMRDWQTWLNRYPKLRIEKRAAPTEIFRLLSHVRNRVILLDDVAALKTEPEERREFEGFLRTVRYNGNRVIMTTHRAARDLPRLVHIVGTSFYWVGPGVRHRQELDSLYNLTNYPISYQEFCDGIAACKQFDAFPIRRAE